MKLTLEKKISLAMFSGVVVTALLCAYGYFIIATLRSDARQTADAHLVQQHLKRLEIALVDAETGQRGYLLTSNSDYLGPYTRGRNEARLSLREYELHVADAPELMRIAVQLRERVDEKLNELAGTIDAFNKSGFAAARAAVVSDRGHHKMDEIRTLIGNAETAALQSVRGREQAHNTSLVHAQWFVTLLVGLYLLVVFAVGAAAVLSCCSAN
jgi:CHASE3 domain sensor protein